MVRTDSWSSRMLALISLELTWTPSIFTCQTGLKSMSDFRYKADQFQLNFAMNFSGSTTISLPNESEFCSAIWGHMYHSFDAYCKSFYCLIFFSVESSGWTKTGLERPPSDPHHSGNLMEYLSTTKGDDSSVHTSKWLSIPVISHRQ